MLAAFKGDGVDRVPIWGREGFPMVDGPAEFDHFGLGWQAEPLYRELFEYIKPYVDGIKNWGFPSGNRFLMIPWKYIDQETILDTPEVKQYRTIIHTPKGDLEKIGEHRRWQATQWSIKDPVQNEDDLLKLASVPFEINKEEIDNAYKQYLKIHAEYGGRVLLGSGVSSPIVCISGAMPLELFLEMSFTHRDLFHKLCEDVTQRILAILETLFAKGRTFDTIFNFGGSEQCTPPMMPAEAYDEYVVPYDGRIAAFLKEHGIPLKIHCHGKVRHALKGMIEMGADATDPVEPPPAGDVTYGEAREIAGNKLTIIGNIELDLLDNGTPKEIRNHVKDICSYGKKRLIIGTSAGPLTSVTRQFVDNYKAMVDAALEFGS